MVRQMTPWLVAVAFIAGAADDVSQALEMETCQGEDCALNALQMRGTIDPKPSDTLGVASGVNATSAVNSSFNHYGCCSGCYTAYCSPYSGTCYSYKGKYYYLSCSSNDDRRRRTEPRRRVTYHDYVYNDCCNSCTNWYYCSPLTGTCYDTKEYSHLYKC